MSQQPKELLLAMMGWGVTFALSVPVSAAAPAADAKAAAELFQRGRMLIAQGKPAEACPKFEEAQRLDPGAGTLYNLADCYERIGKTGSAWSAFVEVVKLAKASKREDREKIARKRIADLEPKLARLVIRVPGRGRIRGLDVMRDSVAVPVSDWGVAIPVNPGPHAIAAAAPGYMTWSSVVHVNTSATTEVKIDLPLLPPPPPPSTEPYSTGMMAGGIVAIVIGSLGLAAGGVLFVLSGFGGEATPGIATMGGGGALLLTGIVLTAVGAHKVPVEGAMRSHRPSFAFSPSFTGIKVSF